MQTAEELKQGLARAEKKRQVESYFAGTTVGADCQVLVNRLYREQPDDVNGYAAEFFSNIAKPPVINRCVVKPGWSMVSPVHGVRVELHCLVNGISKLVAESDTTISSEDPRTAAQSQSNTSLNSKKAAGSKVSLSSRGSKVDVRPSSIAPDQRETPGSSHSLGTSSVGGSSATLTPSAEEVHADVHAGPSGALTRLVEGLSALDLQVTSESLMDCSQSQALSPPTIMATSCAVLKATQTLLARPALDYLLQHYDHCRAYQHSLPFLVIPILSGGSLANGKLKWKEFSLIFQSCRPIQQVVETITTMYSCTRAYLTEKYGPSAAALLPSHGTFAPSLDKVEQAMEVLQNGATRAGYELGTDFDVCITVGANDLYDQEKNKYELTAGQWKAPGDIMTQLSDFIRTWPAVKMLIDPLQKNAHSDWQELRQRVGEHCVLVGESILNLIQVQSQSNSAVDVGGSTVDTTASSSPSVQAAEQVPTAPPQTVYITQLHEWVTKAVNAIIWPSDLLISPTLHHLAVNLVEAAGVDETICVIFSCTGQPMNSTLLLDVAIATKCQYVRLYMPAVQPQFYEHLMTIQAYLQQLDLLDPTPRKHHFWKPPPQEEDEEGEAPGAAED